MGPQKAAQELARVLKKEARYLGKDPAGVRVLEPDDSPAQAWGVAWEGGPLDWGMYLSSGESIWFATPSADVPRGRSAKGGAEVDLMSSKKWHCETYEGFDVQFIST